MALSTAWVVITFPSTSTAASAPSTVSAATAAAPAPPGPEGVVAGGHLLLDVGPAHALHDHARLLLWLKECSNIHN